jgi:AAA15 family ATPase/GTPase
MLYQSFKIKNFKGIQELKLDFSETPKSPIYLLVGLNESGKTTILEALSFFYDNLSGEKELTLRPKVVNDVHDLIPKSKKDNFKESISLECSFKFDQSDLTKLKKFYIEKNTKIATINECFTITTYYDFENSQFKKQRNVWNISIELRQGRQRNSRRLWDTHPLWTESWQYISSLIPPLIYYPNFLFDFPDRIYLEATPNEGKQQAFYRRVLQDVLDSTDRGLDIKTHIVDRIKSKNPQEIDACESAINKMRDKVTSLVLSEKFNIFKGNRANKEIIVTSPKIDEEKKLCYVELKLRDGQDTYYIRERSLGFRWFFSFLLFTQFRIARFNTADNIFFLFDEPASNLHQSAQQRLLVALETLTSQANASVIYTTHSHHMINPKWLESTFIVRNIALDYENEDRFSSLKTDVKVEKYRSFVSKNPTSTNYFQPILDALEYKPSNLEYLPNIVLVEGKNDFYTLSYFFDIILKNVAKPNLCPGSGSGSLDNIMRLYYAWGKNFILFLDGDAEGVYQKRRYNEILGKIVENKIFVIQDVDDSWLKRGMEKLITEEDKLKMQQVVFPGVTKYSKKSFNLAVQELLVRRMVVPLSQETIDNFIKVRRFLNEKLTGN